MINRLISLAKEIKPSLIPIEDWEGVSNNDFFGRNDVLLEFPL